MNIHLLLNNFFKVIKMNNKNIVCKHLEKGFDCLYNKKCIVFDDKGKNLVFCHEIALILNPLFTMGD